VSGRPTKVVPAGARLAARKRAERAGRRRVLLRRTAIALAALLPVGLLGWVVLASPLLAVRSVAVTGTSRLTAAQVLAAADVAPGTPLALVDAGAVIRRVEALRPVADVQVTRGWPGTLRLRVVERRPAAAVRTGTGYLLVDDHAVGFATVTALPPGLVRLQVTHLDPRDPSSRAALAVLDELPQPLRRTVRLVRAASPAGVTLVLADGRSVLWGGVGDASLKATALRVLLRMPGRVFDVSRPGVVTRQ